MREFMIIFRQAFITKAKSKSFIITTIIMVAALFLFANISKLTGTFKSITGGGDEAAVIQVIDQSGRLFEPFKQQFEANESEITIEKSDQTEQTLAERVEAEEIDGFLTLTLNQTNMIHANYTSKSMLDYMYPMMIQDALQSVQTALKAEELSLSGEQVSTLFAPIQFDQHAVSSSAKSQEELNQARGLVYVLMFLIYFAVIMYASMIATEVATEKSSRVMEILISSVSPVKHMFAKVAGIGTLGLLQMIIIGAAGFTAFKMAASDLTEGFFSAFGFNDMNVGTLFYAIVFFLLGYFLYATLAALLGSLVSRTEDVQQMILPMTLLIVAAFLIAVTGLGNPEMTYLKVASFVPFFAPLVMFLRVGMLDLPVWEPVLSIGIMLLTILVLGTFGARIYRGGVLMYGPSRSLKDVKKAIQLGKE
ncbi:ABC transporter permease [Sporosarcina sp. HYO08]|uniref:ABC transporter permease n=1 Tax=Sporosarcina sp. HYO08 TaxID=1759557 RepID=UPI00079AF883|nr:ABC transporter permease [Sporosarcina sp. HYO08]KXH79301.1 hypothetical protein AU377_12020 [Sporosarcina sp. HYO08]